MDIFEMRKAVQEAKNTINRADEMAEAMAMLLVGRLRKASRWTFGADAVADLKRELRDFNIQTHRWKKP